MRGLAIACLLGGCLSVPDGAKPMCHESSDCDQASGEVCEEGVCYGNPPAGPFAASIAPPTERDDVAVTEQLVLPISQDGWLGTIQLAPSLTYAGTLRARCEAPLACDASLAIGATMTVERPAQFAGGPSVRSVVSVEDGAFKLVVPRTGDHDRGYTVTIVPDRRDQTSGAPTTAELLPPLRTEISVLENMNSQDIVLGGANLKVVTGQLRTPIGAGLANYRIVALGRWDQVSPMQEVSTVDYTSTDGKFTIVLSSGIVDRVELVARPRGGADGPVLHLPGVLATESTANHVLALPTTIGQPQTVPVAVQSVDGDGMVDAVRGARVVITSNVASLVDESFATFTSEGTTDDDGKADITLYDGDAVRNSYRISIVPPASDVAGAMYDQPFTFEDRTPMRLPRRLAVRGVVRDASGNPLKDVAVTARPALRFLWSLPDAPQAFLSAIPPATTVTPESGEFVLFVDGAMADVWGFYDLVYEPTAKSYAPSWAEVVELPHDAEVTTVDVPTTSLPDAAFVHGEIRRPAGRSRRGRRSEAVSRRDQHDLVQPRRERADRLSDPGPDHGPRRLREGWHRPVDAAPLSAAIPHGA